MASSIHMSIPWSKPTSQYLETRVGAKPITVELVKPELVKAPEVYKRFLNPEAKEIFRNQLVESIRRITSDELADKFLLLAENLDTNGAVIFGAILNSPDFQKLIDDYTKIMDQSGSRSWIHTYVNLANHLDFLTNNQFNAAFIHPLIIALVSHRIGGPVRVVDARGKNAAPIEVLAQDNMLHIDNTPFNDEYKLIVTWEKGRPSGPKGQNFVFLPGTHRGARQCMITNKGEAWSSENASIFITFDRIEQAFQFQEKSLGKRAVVELTHDTKPLSTLFAAGSLVHHRYRTQSGFARSCMILAFHRAADNPGQLAAPECLPLAARADPLARLLFSTHGSGTEDEFLSALAERMGDIESMLRNIDSPENPTVVIPPTTKELSVEDVTRWKHICSGAPTVEWKKRESGIVHYGDTMSKEEFVVHVGKMMAYDKHGPLDLILYPDAHEEIRKWARNKIREKKPEDLSARLQEFWSDFMSQPEENDLLTPAQLEGIANQLAETDVVCKPTEGETISVEDATRSIRQLLRDLGESIVRCEGATAFLSTSLFIFWAADMLVMSSDDTEVKLLGTRLLQNYMATALLVAKHQEPEV